MSEDTPRAARKTRARRRTQAQEGNFDNVEFLDGALSEPANVLRLKLKQLASMPAGSAVRRVLVLTEIISEDGRGIDIVWSEGDDEQFFIVHDSLASMLTRALSALTSTDE